MPAGLQVFTPDGLVQIDDTWVNFAMISKQSLTSTDNISFDGLFVRGVQFYVASPQDLVFVHCTSEFGFMVRRIETNGNNRCIVVTRALGVTVEVFIFRKQPPAASLYGLQIWNPAGELVFDAASKFCKVKGVIPSFTGSASYNHPAGKKYAVNFPQFMGRWTSDFIPSTSGEVPYYLHAWYTYLLYCRSDGVTVTSLYPYMAMDAPWYAPVPPAPPSYDRYYTGGSSLIADVTGF
ncbi:hypothetical protein ACIPZC_16845 [Pseudomonas sp. NPDC089743]|uniref:hypothetical protein n=1 Tax=Pseudomonas sp. NPDC089743 TaxID=3364471 RepID=UPI003827D6D7